MYGIRSGHALGSQPDAPMLVHVEVEPWREVQEEKPSQTLVPKRMARDASTQWSRPQIQPPERPPVQRAALTPECIPHVSVAIQVTPPPELHGWQNAADRYDTKTRGSSSSSSDDDLHCSVESLGSVDSEERQPVVCLKPSPQPQRAILSPPSRPWLHRPTRNVSPPTRRFSPSRNSIQAPSRQHPPPTHVIRHVVVEEASGLMSSRRMSPPLHDPADDKGNLAHSPWTGKRGQSTSPPMSPNPTQSLRTRIRQLERRFSQL